MASGKFCRTTLYNGNDNASRPPRAARTSSRREFLRLLASGAVAATLCRPAAAFAAAGSGSDAPEPGVIAQSRVGAAACGPCAVANALAHGDPAARRAFHALSAPDGAPEKGVAALIARYGAKPSETYGPKRARYSSDAGLTAEDMPFLVNDALAGGGLTPARADWLDAGPTEDSRAHLRRVHALLTESLARGLPPVAEVRAFSADPGTGRTGSAAAAMSFANLYAHWLALIDVEPRVLPAGAGGFSCRFADSYTGRVIAGFAYAELWRPFMATKGFALKANGTKDWHWLTGHPYVLLALPELPLTIQTRPWHERTFVALTYAVHR